MPLRTLAATVSICALCTSSVFALVVDGNLTDWGVTVADNNGSNFSSWAPGIGLIDYFVEDQDDLAGHDFFLGPHKGGQDYDAEMMAAAQQGSTFYIAIATGMRPDNGLEFFSPGDIYIETSAGVFGIEVGGGPGGGPGGLVTEGMPGSTYILAGGGSTQSHQTTDPLQTAGSIWSNVDWISPAPGRPVQFEINLGSTFAGMSDYVYTCNDDATNQHSVIELAFDLSLLGGASIETIKWWPCCSNDLVEVRVPEPATIMCLMLGGFSLLSRKRR